MGLIFLGSVDAASDATMATVASTAGSLFRQALLPLVQDAIADDEVIVNGVRNIMFRGDLPDGTDLNQFGGNDKNGSWRITSTGHTNGPGITSSGVLEVIRQPGTNGGYAVVQRVTDATGMWFREAIDYGTFSWGAWKKVATTDDLTPARGELPAGADLNTYRLAEHAGSYSILSAGTYLNAPSIDYAGVFEVVTARGNNYSALQRITTQASMWWREAIDHGIGQWGAWKRVATTSDIAGGGDAMSPAAIAYSESADGKVTYVHGDPDVILPRGVASITKMFTVWTARKRLTTAQLDETAIVEAGDIESPHLKVGDVVKIRDLMTTSMVNSDSTAPVTLARFVGLKITPGASDPLAVFRAAMKEEADLLGYAGAEFPSVKSEAKVSARMVVDLFRRFRADAVTGPMGSQLTFSYSVTGPEPRTITVFHTIDPNGAVPLPEFRAGKTGTTNGLAHLVMAWRHPDGTEHTTAILYTLEAATTQRYAYMRKVIDATSPETQEILGRATPADVVESARLITSPDGTVFRITVSNSGTLSAVAV